MYRKMQGMQRGTKLSDRQMNYGTLSRYRVEE